MSMTSRFFFTGVAMSEEGAESCPGSTEADTSSVVTVGSDLTETVSRLVGELFDERDCLDRDFLRCGRIF